MPVLTCAATELPSTQFPSEFRLFAAGANPTAKGTFIFDAQAARDVMLAFAQSGADLPIDLEHLSLDPEARLMRPDATDALAWFRPAVRNGELWATQVRWTPAGQARLSARSQRFISPAALYSTETMRVTSLINAALCARPATYGAQALVAASRSATITTRLPARDKNRLVRLAAAQKTTPSALLASAVRHMISSGAHGHVFAAQTLGLSAYSSPEAVKKEIAAALSEQVESAEAATLSADLRKQIKVRGLTVEQFLKARKAAVKRNT